MISKGSSKWWEVFYNYKALFNYPGLVFIRQKTNRTALFYGSELYRPVFRGNHGFMRHFGVQSVMVLSLTPEERKTTAKGIHILTLLRQVHITLKLVKNKKVIKVMFMDTFTLPGSKLTVRGKLTTATL